MAESRIAGRSVVVLGASSSRARMSNKAVRAYLEAGYRVIPVHPSETEIEGLAVHPTVRAIPDPGELLLLYVRPELGLQALDQAAEAGIKRIYVNPGTGSVELVSRIRELGMEPIETCAIRALGRAPDEFPD
jgi:predicted CoA-binding protein